MILASLSKSASIRRVKRSFLVPSPWAFGHIAPILIIVHMGVAAVAGEVSPCCCTDPTKNVSALPYKVRFKWDLCSDKVILR